MPKSIDKKRSSRFLACSGTRSPNIDSFEPPRFVSSNSSSCGSFVRPLPSRLGSFPLRPMRCRGLTRYTQVPQGPISVNAQLHRLSIPIGRSGWNLREDDGLMVKSTPRYRSGSSRLNNVANCYRSCNRRLRTVMGVRMRSRSDLEGVSSRCDSGGSRHHC